MHFLIWILDYEGLQIHQRVRIGIISRERCAVKPYDVLMS